MMRGILLPPSSDDTPWSGTSSANAVVLRSSDAARSLSIWRNKHEMTIVAFEEIGDRGAAEALRGHVLEVSAVELPDLAEDEFYPFDLEGLVVKDPQGLVLGRVAEVIDAPAHGLLTVALESGQEVLVPFVTAAVPEVALAKGYLVVEPRFLETAAAAAGDQEGLGAERSSGRADRSSGS